MNEIPAQNLLAPIKSKERVQEISRNNMNAKFRVTCPVWMDRVTVTHVLRTFIILMALELRYGRGHKVYETNKIET